MVDSLSQALQRKFRYNVLATRLFDCQLVLSFLRKLLPVGISGGGGREERHFADVCLAIGGRVGWGLRVCKCLQNYVAIRPGAVQLASKVGGVRRKSGLRAGKRASLKRPDEGVDTALGREKKKAEDTENEKHGRRKILK